MGYIEDQRAIDSYIHSGNYYVEDDEKDPVICCYCEKEIKAGKWSYQVEKDIVCEDCLIDYMQINHGRIEE